jgi:hypothetical protein
MRLRSPIASFALGLVIVWLCSTASYRVSFGQVAAKDIDLSDDKLKIIMYSGYPPELVAENLRKELTPEKIILSAKINPDGRFKADGGRGRGMFEGHIAKITGDKLEVVIEQANGTFTPINATVKLKEPINIKGVIGGPVFHWFFFRVIRDVEEK